MFTIFKRKKEKVGTVIKFFKVVNLEQAQEVQNHVKELISSLEEIVFEEIKQHLGRVSMNWGKKEQSMKSFYKLLEDNPGRVVVELVATTRAQDQDPRSHITFVNTLLNFINVTEDQLHTVDIVMYLHDFFIDEKEMVEVARNLYRILRFDYGYAFFLEKGQDLSGEKKIKKSFFSESSTVDKKDVERCEHMVAVKEGHIPELYEFNIFNKKQFEKVKQDSTEKNTTVINDALVLFKNK